MNYLPVHMFIKIGLSTFYPLQSNCFPIITSRHGKYEYHSSFHRLGSAEAQHEILYSNKFSWVDKQQKICKPKFCSMNKLGVVIFQITVLHNWIHVYMREIHVNV